MALGNSLLAACLVLPTAFGYAAPKLSTTRHAHSAVSLAERDVGTSELPPPPAAEACTAQKCLDFAKHIQQSLAPNYTAMDPCVDFEKYSCDGWRATHSYRPEQASISVSSFMADVNRELLHSILEGQYVENESLSGPNRTSDKKNFEKMKVAYNTCKNEDAIKAVGITPIKQILDGFETVYPVKGSTSSNSSNEELTKAIAWLFKRNVAGLVSASTNADDMNPNTVVISVGASELQLPKQYYTKPAVMTNYTRSIAEMLQVISSGKPIDEEPIPAEKKTSLLEKAKRIVDFEAKVAAKTPDPEQAADVKYYYKVKALSELQTIVPEIAIEQYFKALVPESYKVTPDRTVILSDSNYYGNLSSIIKSTPRETLHDYFEWRLLSTWSSRLHNNYSAPVRRFNNILNGRAPDAVSDRWRTCVSEVDSNLGHLLGSAFIQKAFTTKDKQLGDQIITDIKTVFAENFKSLDWMTDKTKEVAAKKVANIIQKVGYQTSAPNEASPQEIEAYYTTLPITESFFNNGFSALEFTQNKSWSDLLKPTDKAQWGMTSPTVNAYYNPPLNEIVFPAGIMQMPVFSGDLPEYVSYGGFGATAGHELTHGFDDNGALYDETGRYREWWDNATTARFQSKTQCFVKQYDKFTVEGLDGERVNINGKQTLGENVADAGGLNAAYRAWKKREKTAYNAPLPGLEKFTNDQLFFISYANSWCESIRKEAVLKQVYSDPHAPADTRTTGPVDNSVDFKQAFNCPVKTATCELW